MWFFFLRQRRAYEGRMSGWSSDGCSSDLMQSLPVCAHRDAALHAARGTGAGRLAEAAAPLAIDAFWTQNPNYQRRPPAADFLDGYGYFVVAGPADGAPACVESPSLAAGVLLLGPGTRYPPHRHPAEERSDAHTSAL